MLVRIQRIGIDLVSQIFLSKSLTALVRKKRYFYHSKENVLHSKRKRAKERHHIIRKHRQRKNEMVKEKIIESFTSVLPVIIIVLILSVLLVPMEISTIALFVVGSFLLIAGMGFFQFGAEMAMTPTGEGVGTELFKIKNILLVVSIIFVVGFFITIAEPDLQVLANQTPGIPNYVLIFTIAIGIGLFLILALLRVRYNIKLSTILIVLYVIVFGLAFFVPEDFLAVAFDSGGVTTGPITVPFIMAMGVGFVSLRTEKNASEDSFGLVAIASVGPILTVLILGILYNPTNAEYNAADIPEVTTSQEVAHAFTSELSGYAMEMLKALLPIVAVFIVFQLVTHRYNHGNLIKVTVGYVYTFIGLVLFLVGVNVGFLPVGYLLGENLASSESQWILIPLGMLIGFFIVKAEPAVQILKHQVEDVTKGAITKNLVGNSLSIGVAVAVGISMLRILVGIPIMWILIPGYLIAIALTFFVPKIFVGIAFDSGGVASGPMTSTFLLPFAIGACEGVGGNIMTDAFGVVAMVAMTPLLTVQIMGLIYSKKHRKAQPIEKPANSLEECSSGSIIDSAKIQSDN